MQDGIEEKVADIERKKREQEAEKQMYYKKLEKDYVELKEIAYEREQKIEVLQKDLIDAEFDKEQFEKLKADIQESNELSQK